MKKRHLLFGAVLAIAVAGAGYGGYIYLRPSLADSVPLGGGTLPYYSPVTLTYNQKLAPTQKPVVKVHPQISGTVAVKDKSVIFTPDIGLEIGQKYTVTVGKVVGEHGVALGSSSVAFTAEFVEDMDLPPEVEAQQQPSPDAPAKFQDDIVDE